jgi:hypothetical protein
MSIPIRDAFEHLKYIPGASTPEGAEEIAQSGPETVSVLEEIRSLIGSGYETVAASQSDQVLGATGAIGDYLSGLLIVPATTAASAVSIQDGSGGTDIEVFAGGGTTALTTLIPFFVPLGIKAVDAGWRVTTGADVSVIAVGNFT